MSTSVSSQADVSSCDELSAEIQLEYASVCSEPVYTKEKENSLPSETPNVNLSKIPVSSRKWHSTGNKKPAWSTKKKGFGSNVKKQPFAVVNKQ